MVKILNNLFITWNITEAIDEDGFEFYYAYDYKLTNLVSPKPNQCVMPLIYLEDLADKTNSYLSVFRTLRMRPRDPYELVEFIRTIENSKGIEY